MKRALTLKILAGVMVLVCITATSFGQDGPPNVFNFLGIPKGLNKVRDNLSNRRGNRPGLERKPPLKALSDPAFLAPEIAEGIPMPKALAEAAKVKIQEDLAPQKIKAVKFLAKMGCGCYNDDGGIVDALAEALGDCTDDVRLATIEALQEVAEDETCEACGTKSCCDEKLLLKLAEIAYDRDDTGCYKEKNEEIREAAIAAMEACCPSPGPIVEDSEVYEGDEVETPPIPEVTPETPLIPGSSEARVPNSSSRRSASVRSGTSRSAQVTDVSRETIIFTSAVLGREPQFTAAPTVRSAVAPQRRMAPVTRQLPPVHTTRQVSAPRAAAPPVYPGHAEVEWVNVQQHVARIVYDGTASVPVGARLQVIHRFVSGRAPVGEFEVLQSTADGAIIRPVGRSNLRSVARGDEINFLR